MRLVGFIIRIYHDARSPELQIQVHLPAYSRARATITQTARQLHKEHDNYTNSTTITQTARQLHKERKLLTKYKDDT